MPDNVSDQFAQVRANIDREFSSHSQRLTAFANRVAKHAAKRSRANAPILDGTLRESIQPVLAKRTTARSRTVKAAVEASAPHAWEVHEEVTPAGPKQLGSRSAEQPGTQEGGVGGKFVERVITFHTPRYNRWFTEMMSQAGRKGRLRIQ